MSENNGDDATKRCRFPITPNCFWETFSRRLRANALSMGHEFQPCYNFHWTPHITQLIGEMAEEFDCVWETEYCNRIDVAYFDRSGENWGEWAWEAAIEIENKPLIWTHEIHKMLLLSVGLKVLIGYENDAKTPLKILEAFPAIYRSRKYHCPGAWLFIFGPRLLPATHDFRAYTFDGEGILDITCGLRTLL